MHFVTALNQKENYITHQDTNIFVTYQLINHILPKHVNFYTAHPLSLYLKMS